MSVTDVVSAYFGLNFRSLMYQVATEADVLTILTDFTIDFLLKVKHLHMSIVAFNWRKHLYYLLLHPTCPTLPWDSYLFLCSYPTRSVTLRSYVLSWGLLSFVVYRHGLWQLNRTLDKLSLKTILCCMIVFNRKSFFFSFFSFITNYIIENTFLSFYYIPSWLLFPWINHRRN